MVPLLAIGSLISVASLGLLLTLLGLAVIGRLPIVAEVAGWSADRLESTLPVPVLVGIAAGISVAVLFGRTVISAGRIMILLCRSDRLSRRLRGGGPPIVMVDEAVTDADAFTLAGIKGCVVINRRLFAALGTVERQMLTAHELSHLRRRHHLYVHAADLAVAANPALAQVADAVRLGVERWADEDAAATLQGDRRTAAAALARTALVQTALRRSGSAPASGAPALAVAASHVPQRALALMAPTPRRSPLSAGLAAVVSATCVATVISVFHLHNGFEQAEIIRQLISH